MKTGIVINNLVASVKHATHLGKKLMVVQPVDINGKVIGPSVIAIDCAGAGVGDFVIYSDEGGASRMAAGSGIIDASIMGILDYFPGH